MDIYLTETGSGGRRFTFPSLPERIRVKNSTNYQSFDILSMGTIKIPKGMTPTTISWEGVFFGEAKKKESIVKTCFFRIIWLIYNIRIEYIQVVSHWRSHYFYIQNGNSQSI